MKLVAQVNLWFSEGSSDKLYEVDLLQVGPDQYLVNFRYGRRGANLKDGSKTPSPVGLAQAQKIFDALVAEKKKGGYQDVGGGSPTPPAPDASGITPDSAPVPSDLPRLIQRLSEAIAHPDKLHKRWKASRIAWRIGQLRLQHPALEGILLGYLPRAKEMEQYAILHTLVRCGISSPAALKTVRVLAEAAATKPAPKRMAQQALFLLSSPAEQSGQAATLMAAWPDPLRQSVVQGDLTAIAAALDAMPHAGATLLPHLLLLMHGRAEAAAFIASRAGAVPARPGVFQVLRQLYKLSILLDLHPLFAATALRIQRQKPFYNRPQYGSWIYTPDGYIRGYKEERAKPEPKIAFSNRTRAWFMQDAVRHLRDLGKDHPDAYIAAATEVLLRLDDKTDRQASVRRVYYSYDYSARRYNTTEKHYDVYAAQQLMHQLLFARSTRYKWTRGARAAQCVGDYLPGNPFGPAREEAFPEHWDAHPEALLRLLIEAQCEGVQDFALLAFQQNPKADALLTADAIRALLSTRHSPSIRFALLRADRIHDPAHPDLALVRALLTHTLPEARAVAGRWITQSFEWFAGQPGFLAEAIVQPHEDVSAWAEPLLRRLPGEAALATAGRALALMQGLSASDPHAEASARHGASLLATHFLALLSGADLAVVADLLAHPVANVAIFGAIILSHHQTPAGQLPASMIAGLIESTIPELRQVGVRLFSQLPEEQLRQRREELLAFCLSPHPELRQTIQPAISRLAADAAFAQALADDLLPYMQRKEPFEGLQEDLLALFTGPLHAGLAHLGRDRAIDLLFDRRTPTQRLGLHILKAHVPASSITMRQLVSFGGHQRADVRQYTCDLYVQEPQRIVEEAREALRLLDSAWDDTRAFAIHYFDKVFPADAWTAELIVAVCDSTRPEIQRLGSQLLTRHFEGLGSDTVLLQLSQHPAPNVQNYSALMLGELAAGRPDMLPALEPFFVTLLAHVNRSGHAKELIYTFLARESAASEAAAAVAARVLGRHSATAAVRDKARCIAILAQIRQQYPHIPSPLSIHTLPTPQ